MEQTVKGTLYVYTTWVVMLGVTALFPLQAFQEERDNACKSCLEHHYQSARESIIKVWTVVDLLRSITIAPEARTVFVQQMFDDSVIVMHDMAALANSCRFCTDYYKGHMRDFIYLEEILGHLMEAFSAVFTPVLMAEEKLLITIMSNVIKSMEHIQKNIGITTNPTRNFM